MTLAGVYQVLARCLARMPRGYPKPRLVVHESAEAMVELLGERRWEFQLHRRYPSSLALGMADADTGTIHLPFTAFANANAHEIADTLLHELGHLYSAQKHGRHSRQYLSEARANAFARRWLRRLHLRNR